MSASFLFYCGLLREQMHVTDLLQKKKAKKSRIEENVTTVTAVVFFYYCFLKCLLLGYFFVTRNDSILLVRFFFNVKGVMAVATCIDPHQHISHHHDSYCTFYFVPAHRLLRSFI